MDKATITELMKCGLTSETIKEEEIMIESLLDLGLTAKQIVLHFENDQRVNAWIESGYERRQLSQQSEKGKKKKGRIGPVKITLDRIVSGIGSTRLEDVLNAIEDDVAAELCETHGDPTPIIFERVDRISETVSYIVRKTGKEKNVPFGTLNNNLTFFR